MIENEDLRDRLNLVGQNSGVHVDHIPYQAPLELENVIENADGKDALAAAKNFILSNVFSLRKQNRALNRRIKNFEEKQK